VRAATCTPCRHSWGAPAAKHDKFASIGFDKYCEIVAVNGRGVASAAMRAPPSMVSRASFGGAIKPRRPVTEPLTLRIHFRFRGMADMAGLAVGLTQSRLTQSRHERQSFLDSHQQPRETGMPN
jgi:hypothetical protein